MLDFPVFDADNHMYETREALTKFLPQQYAGAIDYVEVRGRTKIVIRGTISEYIPNPTFDVVAAPGAQEDYYRHGNPDGKTYRQMIGDPMRCLPAFREPGPRAALMDELGIDRALMFPTLASLIEERMKDDPALIQIVVHSLNQWMYETWQFNYEDRIFATPIISMGLIDEALAELDWVIERGARCVLIRPAPVPGPRGTSSPGLPQFDPIWERISDAGILVGMHASDSGYNQIANWWEASSEFLPFQPSAFRMISQGKRPITDTMAAMVCHGAFTRFPNLKLACVENGANWVKHLLSDMADAYDKMPHQFEEDPTVAFLRNVYINPFWEENLASLVDLVGEDHVLFGSDYPHPEGLKDPISYVDELDGLPAETVRKIMGETLAGLMGVKVPA
ncbi:MAG TPA: amidohydrolase family protein [Acidimicrobiales bacterium]|jgi:predicted TIM-barrel fold metal-dependent hydrolase|nr:amidohydrolase family protein [Acidimicrobiales bacterium]